MLDTSRHGRALADETQLLQEIQLMAESSVSPPSSSGTPPGHDMYAPRLTYSGVLSKSALGFKDSQDFQRLLDDKAKTLKSRSEALFKRLEGARGEIKPDVAELEDQVKTLLANQKQLVVKVGRLESENSSLSEQLDTQTLKALKAERKLDRVRSAQVLKLEQQAMGTATKSANEENGTPFSSTSGDSDELRQQYQETAAALAKTKEQLQAMSAEVKALQEENTAFKVKREGITDEDYVRTDVFKRFKLQNEDLIKRINSLQATNKELREDAEKLRAERTAYRVQLESEAQAVTLELEEQIQLKDQDLTRIRSARDELTAELAMRKATESQERTAAIHMKELAEAKDDRIAELESELERLRPKEDAEMTDAREDLDALAADELRQKYLKLEKNFEAINMEIPLLEKSYKKAMALAHKKVMDFHALEERVAIITAEKSKADQKYFAARKDTDIRMAENRALRAQNGKSSEIISTLKDLDQQSKGLLGNLEKQVVDLKQSNSAVMVENKKLEQTSAEATRRAEALKSQMSEFVTLVKSKDASTAALKEKTMDCETEVEKLKVKVKNAAKESEKWKAKAQGKTTMEEEQLRVSRMSAEMCRDCVLTVFSPW